MPKSLTLVAGLLFALSANAADQLQSSGIDDDTRGKQKASDHAPVWCEISVA